MLSSISFPSSQGPTRLPEGEAKAVRLIRFLGHQTGSPKENFLETYNIPTSCEGIKNTFTTQHAQARAEGSTVTCTGSLTAVWGPC